jgi:hypothetical protein
MARRTIVTSLWFASIYLAGEVIWSVAGTPRALNAILAVAAATFVFVDPFRVFHPRSEREIAPAAPPSLTPDARLVPR